MKTLDEVISLYHQIISETRQELNKISRRIYCVGTMRLIVFMAGIAGIIFFRNESYIFIAGIAVCAFIPFLVLVKRHNRLFYRKEYLEKKIEINEWELKAIDYDTSAFDGGEEFINPAHPYSFDLDLFGTHSLFQYMNRTATLTGKVCLANWFHTPLNKKDDIENRQEAVRELAPELTARQDFRIIGLLYKGKITDEKEITHWAESPVFFRRNPVYRILPALITAINALLIALAATGMVSFNIPGMTFVTFALFSFFFTKRIIKIQALYGKKLQILKTYANLICIIEGMKPQSKLLKQIKASLTGNEKQTASKAINRLSTLMNALDQRNNIFVAILLNGLFFRELRQVMKIEAWKENQAADLPRWLEVVGKMDVLCSLATYAYNHPDYTYPQVTAVSFKMRAKAMGHPLIHREKCVRNDIDIQKRAFFLIVTGANMAGKSTYLRTVAVNYLLACTGAPVCAMQMEFYPAKLITGLRTSDSLNNNESYFFAELKRLKLIVDELKAGEELFVILDEILKGTNSTDKQTGSFALIKQLVALRTNGIIATHDLQLGTLADTFPDNIRNYCFEAEMNDNELTFSYQLKRGIAQNMNACFLMKKMGIGDF
ncbi:DNA mismatch repair protein MutS [termite gut metagenome]|uniref:DNA mismatch repair protein MutS n=1 Tax=termite gut metagenome TaxID=433724 RepID=A0A5J4RIV8_9ZZZZ